MASKGIILHTPLQTWSTAGGSTIASALDCVLPAIQRKRPAYVLLDNVRGILRCPYHCDVSGYSFVTIDTGKRVFMLGRRQFLHE